MGMVGMVSVVVVMPCRVHRAVRAVVVRCKVVVRGVTGVGLPVSCVVHVLSGVCV